MQKNKTRSTSASTRRTGLHPARGPSQEPVERANILIDLALDRVAKTEALSLTQLDEAFADAERHKRRAVTAVMGLWAVRLLASLGAAIGLARTFLPPLDALRRGALALAAGDLSHRVELELALDPDLPDISATSCDAMVRPRPVPPNLRVEEAFASENASKMARCFSGAMPIPLRIRQCGPQLTRTWLSA